MLTAYLFPATAGPGRRPGRQNPVRPPARSARRSDRRGRPGEGTAVTPGPKEPGPDRQARSMKVALLVPGGVDRSGTHRVIPFLLWLIERLAATNSTVVPTLQLFAQRLGLSPHVTPPFASFDDLTWLDADQRAWAAAGYRIMAEHVRAMWEAGIPLAVGTDWAEPGPAARLRALRAVRSPLRG